MPQVTDLENRARALFEELRDLPLTSRIDAINRIRRCLHEHSPFAAEPVDCVLWVPGEQVQANDYNPNSVAPPEMRLLELSIEADGYTQPIVAHHAAANCYVVVDGFHRQRVGQGGRVDDFEQQGRMDGDVEGVAVAQVGVFGKVPAGRVHRGATGPRLGASRRRRMASTHSPIRSGPR